MPTLGKHTQTALDNVIKAGGRLVLPNYPGAANPYMRLVFRGLVDFHWSAKERSITLRKDYKQRMEMSPERQSGMNRFTAVAKNGNHVAAVGMAKSTLKKFGKKPKASSTKKQTTASK